MLLGTETAAELKETASLQRSAGEGRLAVAALDGRTRIARLYQGGSAKIRVPRLGQAGLEAVLINTSGGLTGGDRMDWALEAGAGTHLTLTTQACEKVYRSSGGRAEVRTRISVGEDARVDWLPQETILFDRSALSRRIDVELSRTAEFMAVEPVIIGRKGMGETVSGAEFHDRWRISRDGKLVHAEDTRLEGDIPEVLRQAATTGGQLAFATVLFAGQRAEALKARLNDLKADRYTSMSAWNGKLVIRLVAAEGFALRKRLLPVLSALRDVPLPRIWHS